MNKSVVIGIIFAALSIPAMAQSEDWIESASERTQVPGPQWQSRYKTEGWLEKHADVVQASDNRLVFNALIPDVNPTDQLPRRYGFTRGAMLPLIGAAGDSISTHIALKQPGIYETNRLINTSPGGLLGLFFIKATGLYILDQQKPEIRKPGLKIAAGLFNGVTINNLFLAAGATNPVSIVGGIAYGIYAYHKEAEILEQEEALATGSGEPMWDTR